MSNQNTHRPMLLVSESGYRGHVYVHTDVHRAPLTFFWWASTPTGRQSVHWHVETVYRTRSSGKLVKTSAGDLTPAYVPTGYYAESTRDLWLQMIERQAALLPKIPRGYTWNGPFIYSESRPPIGESETFRFRAPETSAGIPIGYQLPQPSPGGPLQLAASLASKVLADRRVSA